MVIEKEEDVTVKSLIKDVGDYIETKIDLLKLQAVDKTSDVTSSVITGLVTLIIFWIVLTFINFGLAILIGTALGKMYLGFFIIAGFYILLGLLVYAFRKKWVKEPIANSLIKKLLN